MGDVENWKPVVGWETRYVVSSDGRVRSNERGELKQHLNDAGYLSVWLYNERGRRRRTIHTLVAEAFIGPRPEGLQVRHLDGDKSRPDVSNLAYGTSSENHYDAVKHGTHAMANRKTCPQGHPYDATTPDGRRYCKRCKREKTARSRA